MISSEALVRERMTRAIDEDHKKQMYWLRQVVANFIDGSGVGNPKSGEGRFNDFIVQHFEEGRYNPISVNTQVAVEALTYGTPDAVWQDVPSPAGKGQTIAAVRWAYFLKLYEDQCLGEAYGQKLLDLITLGEANMGCFVRGAGVEVEWCDSLLIDWDPTQKDPEKRRYVCYTTPMTLAEAAARYPGIRKFEPFIDDKTGEKVVDIKRFWDRDNQTFACMYKRDFIHGPTKNDYPDGMLPIRATTLTQLPSNKYRTGIVERAIGSQAEILELQRHFRETALRATGTRVALGNFNEDQLRALENDDNSVILRGPAGGGFTHAKGPEIQATSLERYQMLMSDVDGQMGTNSFERNQEGQNVDFASQLGYLAQQGGSRKRWLSLKFEEGMRQDILKLIMPIAAAFEARNFSLKIGQATIDFGGTTPINPMLGSDGNLVFKPGGMTFKSEAQGLQEAMIFSNVVALSAQLPPGLQERFVRYALDAARIEDPEDWIADMKAASAELAARQAQDQAMMADAVSKGEEAKAQKVQSMTPQMPATAPMR